MTNFGTKLLSTMKQLCYLDYLHGLVASGKMIFHFLSCANGKLTADTLMGKIGVYCVSIFLHFKLFDTVYCLPGKNEFFYQ